MRRIALVPAVAALLTAVFTAFAVWFGPKPTVLLHSSILNDPSLALAEPTDRAILIGWWAIAIIMALAAGWILRRNRKTSARSTRGGPPAWVVVALGVTSFGLIITSILSGIDKTGLWPGISTLGLFVGFAFALLTFKMWTLPRWLAVASTLAVCGLVLAYALPMLLQTPGALQSPGNFAYTSDEISAVAAGHFPLSDYIPQYSVLLGFPIAPLIQLLGARAIYGVVAWLILLQVIALTVSVILPILVGGWRVLAPVAVVAIVPSLSGGPTAYFAALPMRVVLPSLTILATFLLFRNRQTLTVRYCSRLFVVAVASGLTMLNNPDFGIPAGVAVLVVAFIVIPTVRAKAISVMILALGSSFPFVAYSIAGRLAGHPVDWSQWLVFQKTFGAEGFNAVAMDPFGLHIAFVTLFISASVVGFALMVKYRNSGSRFGYRQGVLLALVGGWSLLSLPYFAGRSMTPTLVTGYSFMGGMVAAAFLPLLRMTLRRLRVSAGQGSLELAVSLGLGALAIAGAASTLMLVRLPSDNFLVVTSAPPGRFEVLLTQTVLIQAVRDSPAGSDLNQLIHEGRVQQAVDMSSLTSFSAGIPSGSVATNPAYFYISPIFTRAQCGLPWAKGIDYLLVLGPTANALEMEPSCGPHFDFAGKRSYTAGGSTFILLPRPTAARATN